MSKRAFVTGATGFLGQNLMAELCEEGWEVVAMVRSPAKAKHLAERGVRLVHGDLSSAARLAELLPEQVDAVFHVAANISLRTRDAAHIHRDNAIGSANLIAAALQRRARRFVMTSTSAVWGLSHHEFDEQSERRGRETRIPYVLSKMDAEAALLDACSRGLAGVIVNPGHIVGAYDQTGWARLLRDVHAGRVAMAPPGIGTFCHARALARAQIAAAVRGEVGSRYLIGGAVASFSTVMRVITTLLGRRAIERVAPAWLVTTLARASELRAKMTGKPPDVTSALAQIVCGRLVFRSDRAVRDLGYQPAALETMFGDSLAWLQTSGLLRA